jgi:DNA-binding CsgD family transcriptional regulator/aryl carrier-like protein
VARAAREDSSHGVWAPSSGRASVDERCALPSVEAALEAARDLGQQVGRAGSLDASAFANEGYPWVSLDHARLLLDGLDRLDPGKLAERWLRRHAGLRALAELAATPRAWLDLFLRSVAAMHPFVALRWQIAGKRLTVETDLGPRASLPPGWSRFSCEAIRRAPILLGADPMRLVRHDARFRSSHAIYELSSEGSSIARMRRASGIPFAAIFVAIRSLSAGAVDVDPRSKSREPSAHGPCSVERFAREHRLTAAESKVLELLDSGLRTDEIAAQLTVRVSTIRSHLKRIYVKTRASGQRALLDQLAASRLS